MTELDLGRSYITQKVAEHFNLSVEVVQESIRANNDEIEEFLTTTSRQQLTWFYQPRNQRGEKPVLYVGDVKSEVICGETLILLKARDQNDGKAFQAFSCISLAPPAEFFSFDRERSSNGAGYDKKEQEQSDSKVSQLVVSKEIVMETLERWEQQIRQYQAYETESQLSTCKDILVEAQIWESKRAILQLLQSRMEEDYRVKNLQSLVNKDASLFQRWHNCELQIMEWLQYADEKAAIIAILVPAFEPFGSSSNKNASSLKSDLSNLFSHLRNAVAASPLFSREKELCSLLRILSSMLEHTSVQLISKQGSMWVENDREHLIILIQDILSLQSSFVKESNALVLGMPHQSKLEGKESESSGDGVLSETLLPMKRLTSRCNACLDMLGVDLRFERLARQSHIKGLPEIVNSYHRKFQSFRLATSSASRVFALQAYPTFEQDVLDFMVHTNDLERAVQRVLREDFDQTRALDQALIVLRQNVALLPKDVVQGELDYMLQAIMDKFGEELDRVEAVYDKHKADPCALCGMPPTAGSIAWTRSLLRRLERPMRLIASFNSKYYDANDADEGSRSVLVKPENRKIIKKYNRLGQTLLECETMWHEDWLRKVTISLSALESPVLVYDCKQSKLTVSLEPSVIMAIKEGLWFLRLGLAVPPTLHNLLLCSDRLYSHYGALSTAVRRLEITCDATPLPLRSMVNFLRRRFMTIWGKLGSTNIAWTSATMDGFIESFEDAIERFCEAISQAAEAHAVLVERVVTSVSQVAPLRIHSKSNCALSFDEFITLQEEYLDKAAKELVKKKEEVKAGRIQVCQCLFEGTGGSTGDSTANDTGPEGEYYKPLVESYFGHCDSLFTYALKAVIHGALKGLVGLFDNGNSHVSDLHVAFKQPIIRLDLNVEDAVVKVYPSLPEIDRAINYFAKRISALSIVDNHDHDHDELVHILRDAVSWISPLVESLAAEVSSKFCLIWNESKYEEDMPEGEVETSLEEMVDLRRDLELLPNLKPITHAICLSYAPYKNSTLRQLECRIQFASQQTHAQAVRELLRLVKEAQDLQTSLTQTVVDLSDMESLLDSLDSAKTLIAGFELQAALVQATYEKLDVYGVIVPKSEQELLVKLPSLQDALQGGIDSATETVLNSQELMMKDVAQASKSLIQVSKRLNKQWESCQADFLNSPPAEAHGRLDLLCSEFESHRQTWEFVIKGEKLFQLRASPLSLLSMLEDKLLGLQRLYDLYRDVEGIVKEYGAMEWKLAIQGFQTLMATCMEYKGRCKLVGKELRESYAYRELKQVLDDILSFVPVMQGFGHPATKDRHWVELGKLASQSIPLPQNGLTLGHILEDRELMRKKKEDVEYLCQTIIKEDAAELKFNTVLDQWSNESLTFSEHKQRGMIILKPTETSELMERLEDSSMVLSTLSSNRFSSPFRPKLQDWIGKLAAVAEIMEQWLTVQSLWSYMESVFSGGDIARQLPSEAQRFGRADEEFIRLVSTARETGKVMEVCCGSDTLRHALPLLLEQLELCQKGLAAYLETKRAAFPRFYFVSDSTLLEILSLGSNPASVVRHLQSGLFDSIANVTFDPKDEFKITEIWSREGECVPLDNPVEAKGPVEEWLQRLVNEMQETMRSLIREAAADAMEAAHSEEIPDVGEFVFSRPAQAALLGLQLWWSEESRLAVHAASRNEKGALQRVSKRSSSVLRALVEQAMRSDLTKLQRTCLETCITVYMHQKEASEELVRNRVRDLKDFNWLKNCRVTWQDDKNTVMISICDVDLEYSYEYLGVKERLVITPLTDVCYITLTQALGMYLGGAPAGPAGTGKTETTKDLGATLGKYVVVFNCSDQMDHHGMGKIFKGLAQSGLWGCFDEFNRINLDVLSVCAQQIHCVLNAVREGRKSFTFTDGSVVPLDPRVGIFITMNPGYAGRQELPENLKALFRGVTMMVPNRQTIMKVKLAAAGYQENELISRKFNALYSLCEQQLSKQAHYDFGLRNILSVLRTAGASKRASPHMNESELIMRSLREMNVSKLVADDVPLFSALLEDLFPSQKVQTKQVVGGEKDAVLNALASICRSRGLEPEPAWIKKCMQLYETYLVRHGIMVIGPPGSGKSMAVDCLASALTEIGQKTVVLRMNPKAITAPQMFGRLDPATGDWTDGVFSNMWRRASRAPKGQSTWIVLDGPVDAVWIENLNTVLDDNKVLTLANGDRIAMSPQMRLIFEAENLKNASPATVSRAGIVYMSSSELGWRPLIQSWLLPKAPRERAALGPLFDKYLPPSLDFVRLECTPVVILEETCLVTTLCTMLTGALSSEDRHEGVLISAKWIGAFSNDVHGLHRAYERCFLLCLSWAVGGVLCQEDRCRYDHLLRGLASTFMPEVIDGADTIFDYGIDEKLGTWIPWHQKVPAWTPPHDRQAKRPAASSMMVPTVDSVRYDWILSTVRAAGGASLLVGETGTAKTTIVQQYLSHFDIDSHIAKTITFSSLTTPHIFQTALEGFVDKIQGRTYGPPGGKIATIFLDDLSMPAINKWGDQETNELVRQVLEQKGWYSTNKPVGEWKSLTKVSFLAAMGLPGRKDIPNRLKRQFCIFHLAPPSKKSLKGIFGQLMDIHFGTYTGVTLSNTAQQVVSATISLLQATQRYLVPTPSKFHYSFTMRDISKVFQGIMTADMNALSGSAGHGTVTKLPGGGAAAAAAALTSSQYLVILWAHECRRVFADKLISHEDALWLDAQILKAAGEYFSIDVMEAARQSSTVFVDFLRDPELEESTGEPIGPRPKCYELVPGGFSQTRSRIEVLVEEGYRSGLTGDQAPPRLVLFDDALAHAVRIARILSMERGSALLVGVEGSGKQSLARLAAYLAGVSIFKITQSKSYGIANLLEDLRAIYKAAAFQPQPLMLLLTESEIRHESFLEYFNQILMTGEVAGLFPRDEMDVLLSDIRPLMRSTCPALPDTRDNLYSFFINRVRDRLHIVLCVSPMGGRLSRWAVQFPGIINGCTIDWFLPWPDDALLAVSSVMLQPRLQAARKVMAVAHAHVSSACNRYRQEQGRSVFFTPKSYISALNVLQTLHERKSQELQTLNHQLKTGLEKMDDAKTDVNKMSVQLAAKEIELEKSNDEAAKLLEEIKESTLATEKEKSKVANIVQSVRQKAEEIAQVKADAERDLAQAQPALDAALAALNSIAPKDIVSLKALRSPPDVIKRIFDCVLLLRHYPVNPVSWHEVKGSKVILGSYEEAVRMMGDLNFLQALLSFPKEAINDETVELLQPYFQAADFNYESARKASGNVAGLCNWAASMCTYHEVAKAVEPKIAALRLAERELATAEEEQAEAEAELAKVQASFDSLQARLQEAMDAKKALEDDAASTRRKMENATKLLGALGGEGERWREQATALATSEECLLGDCIVMSVFLSYGGAFNRSYREHMILNETTELCSKYGLSVTNGLDPATFLVGDEEIACWAEEGLPGDPLSLQNGILVTRATKYPLLIDPQGQGRAWLAKHEGPHGLVVTNFKEDQFRVHLESCLIHGRPLLIENVDEDLDPMLEPVLNKNYVQRGDDLMVTLGDQEVQVAPGFKLYLASRLSNPSFSPDVQSKVCMIDFTVTTTGLEDQLLGVLVLMEKEQLEHRRRQLVSEIISSRAKISKLESDLLMRLSSSSGNLLEDTGLIDMLSVTKQTALEVTAKLTTAASARKEINEACEEYRPAAHRATLLYFLMSEFSRVNCMYQTSLEQFIGLYESSIECTAVRTANMTEAPIVERVTTIIKHFTRSVFEFVQRGLYEKHKSVFALMLALKVAMSEGYIQETEMETYFKLGTISEATSRSVKRKPKEWVSPVAWNNILLLSTSIPKPFASLPDLIVADEAGWKAWNDGEAPETMSPPTQATQCPSSITSAFYKTCLVRAFREDRALAASQQFVLEVLKDQAFIEPSKPELEDVFVSTNPLCPIVCLLSPGADPTKSIEEMAKKRRMKCASVSMGQGQEVVARKLVANAAREGHWVLIQNAHLSVPYLSELEKFLGDAKTNEPHSAFRLWITTEPESSFPLGILYASIKLTNEAPSGMRASLRSISYELISQDNLEAVPSKEWRRLLFVLCYMHSVVQERRRFGPIGWNIPYEFNASDLVTSIQFAQNHMMEMYLKRLVQPDWPTLRYMISTIIYGGRITDEQDRALMDAIVDYYLNESIFVSTQNQTSDKKPRSSNLMTGFHMPDAQGIQEFRGAIDKLLTDEGPETFGLHANADLTYRSLKMKEIMSIIQLATKGSRLAGMPGLTREASLDALAKSYLEKLPPIFEPEVTRKALNKLPGGFMSPLNVHLRQEIERLNRLLQLVGDALETLRLALAGSIALGDTESEYCENLRANRVPVLWEAISWESSSLSGWFQSLISRHDQLHRWLTIGRPNSFWLTGFLNPQGFLTAVKQEVMRYHAKEGWALDDVVLKSDVTRFTSANSVREPLPVGGGVYIHGLFLEGCSWSAKEGKLKDPQPRKLFSSLPVVRITATLAKDANDCSGYYYAPCYKSPRRTQANFITKLRLKTDEAPSRWILRGAAVLCDVN